VPNGLWTRDTTASKIDWIFEVVFETVRAPNDLEDLPFERELSNKKVKNTVLLLFIFFSSPKRTLCAPSNTNLFIPPTNKRRGISL